MNALKVRCDNFKARNFKTSCEWTGELAALQKHLDKCDHALVPCPNECKVVAHIVKVRRKDLKVHLKDNCPNRSYECPHCKLEGKHHDITTSHRAICPKVAVTCPNTHCGERIKRCDMANHRKECPFQVVPCKYSKIGCGEKRIRKKVKYHENRTASHFHLAMETVGKLKEKLTQFEKKRFNMLRFNYYKTSGESFMSPAFYTHQDGYKVYIQVDTNGNDKHKGTHISVFAYFLQGEFDDSLTWPFTGSVTVTLLNQLEDKHHHQYTIEYPEGTEEDINSRVTTGQTSLGYGTSRFISYGALGHNPVTNCQYLKEDCLCFEVSVRADSIKPWLAPTL